MANFKSFTKQSVKTDSEKLSEEIGGHQADIEKMISDLDSDRFREIVLDSVRAHKNALAKIIEFCQEAEYFNKETLVGTFITSYSQKLTAQITGDVAMVLIHSDAESARDIYRQYVSDTHDLMENIFDDAKKAMAKNI